MIDHHGLEALRAAATLAHVLPVRLRLRHADRVLVEVARPPFEPVEGARWVPPCGFRTAAANAWLAARVGRRVALEGLPAGSNPVIEVGVPPGGCTLPGGIHRIPLDHLAVLAFATTADPALARATTDQLGIGYHHDELTDVVVLHLATSEPSDEPEVRDLLETALARMETNQLLADVSGV